LGGWGFGGVVLVFFVGGGVLVVWGGGGFFWFFFFFCPGPLLPVGARKDSFPLSGLREFLFCFSEVSYLHSNSQD